MTVHGHDLPTADILSLDLAALRHLRPESVRWQLTREEFVHIFRTCDALWLHDGNLRHPHAELTSGKCSDGFINVLQVLRYTNLCQIMADQLVRRLNAQFKDPIHWVIGSDHAGATLSY